MTITLHTAGVSGSNPLAPTNLFQLFGLFLMNRPYHPSPYRAIQARRNSANSATAQRGSRMRPMKPYALLVLCLSFGCAADAPSLQVSATKGRNGISLTNRHQSAVTACRITLLERGRPDEWTATVERIESLETARIDWDNFRAPSGHEMPPGIGPNAKHFTVACAGADNQRLTAGLAF
jgi:hypothetical protein